MIFKSFIIGWTVFNSGKRIDAKDPFWILQPRPGTSFRPREPVLLLKKVPNPHWRAEELQRSSIRIPIQEEV